MTKETALAKASGGALATAADVERVKEAARTYAAAAKATNTRAAYATATEHFEAWCARFGQDPWTAGPETIVAYLSDLASNGAAWNTVALHRAALSVRFTLLGRQSPTRDPRVREVMAGIRRASPAPGQRAPLTLDLLPVVLTSISTAWVPAVFWRARAIILLGVATALRGEQIAALRFEQMRKAEGGISIRIGKEKTDQLGKGRVVYVPRIGGPLCPCAALEEWIGYAKITAGPVFRGFRRGHHPSAKAITRREVWQIVKSAAKEAGLDPTDFGAHSLRAGFVTSARARGMDWGEIMRQTGHKRIDTVLKYDRPAEDDPAAFARLAKMMKGGGNGEA